jgi:excisionase family DNA binding protein
VRDREPLVREPRLRITQADLAKSNGAEPKTPRVKDALLTPAEVAELLAVTRRWVEDATRRGDIPHIRLGRFPRYRRETIDEWLAELERAGTRGGTR